MANNVRISNNFSKQKNKFIKNLEKAERKALKKSALHVANTLRRNVPVSNKIKEDKLVNNVVTKNPRLKDGVLSSSVGFDKDAWYYVFTNSGVNSPATRRKYQKSKVPNSNGYSNFLYGYTRPYSLQQRKQNYIERTIKETNNKVADIVKDAVNTEILKISSRNGK